MLERTRGSLYHQPWNNHRNSISSRGRSIRDSHHCSNACFNSCYHFDSIQNLVRDIDRYLSTYFYRPSLPISEQLTCIFTSTKRTICSLSDCLLTSLRDLLDSRPGSTRIWISSKSCRKILDSIYTDWIWLWSLIQLDSSYNHRDLGSRELRHKLGYCGDGSCCWRYSLGSCVLQGVPVGCTEGIY